MWMGQDSTLWDYLGLSIIKLYGIIRWALSDDMGLLDGHYQMIWDY